MTLHYGNPAAQNRSVDDVNFLLGATPAIYVERKKERVREEGIFMSNSGTLKEALHLTIAAPQKKEEFRANRISLIDLLLQSSNAFHGPSKDA